MWYMQGVCFISFFFVNSKGMTFLGQLNPIYIREDEYHEIEGDKIINYSYGCKLNLGIGAREFLDFEFERIKKDRIDLGIDDREVFVCSLGTHGLK